MPHSPKNVAIFSIFRLLLLSVCQILSGLGLMLHVVGEASMSKEDESKKFKTEVVSSEQDRGEVLS